MEDRDDDLPDGGVRTVVRMLPIRGADADSHLPFLFVEGASGEVHLNREVLHYARALLPGYDLSTIDSDVRTVARLYDFQRIFWGDRPLPDDALEQLITAYLIWRHNGTLHEGGSRLGGLRWQPLAAEGLKAEFKAIIRFVRHSERHWGTARFDLFKVNGGRQDGIVRRLIAIAEQKNRDFLVHLSASRDYWRDRHGHEVEIPRIVHAAKRRSVGIRTVISEEEVWGIIRAERNPAFRALWLMGAFGGIRISEQLNLWQEDVLPASKRRLLFGYDGADTPVVVRADPIASRYTGDLGKLGQTRKEVLRERYGMVSRKSLPKSDPLYAGWKGTLWLDAQRRISEVFWIDERAAALYDECAREIREFHRLHQTSTRHPFFYVNMADPTKRFRSGILKISNVEHAWVRACHRCHLEAHRWGRSIHGLRHFFKSMAHSLGISADHLQIMLGHSSIDSQNDYGRAARDVANALSGIRERRFPTGEAA